MELADNDVMQCLTGHRVGILGAEKKERRRFIVVIKCMKVNVQQCNYLFEGAGCEGMMRHCNDCKTWARIPV